MDVAGLPALIDALGPISAPPHARPATPAEAALHAAPLAGLHSLRAAARDFAEDVAAEPDVAAMLKAVLVDAGIDIREGTTIAELAVPPATWFGG